MFPILGRRVRVCVFWSLRLWKKLPELHVGTLHTVTKKSQKPSSEIELDSRGGAEEQQAVPKTSILVQGAVDGDRDSLEQVITHLSPLVEAQVRFRLGHLARNTADVEDLVAEVWTVVFRRLPDLRPRDGHYARVLVKYLATTSHYLCNNFLRRSMRRKTIPLVGSDSSEEGVRADELARETRSVVTRVFEAEVSEMIRSGLDRLSDEKRRVLVLRLMEHRTNQEIAELMDLLPNTVAVKYSRALGDLRDRLPQSVFQTLWSFRNTPAHESG